ncbi:phospholipid carrier-dependent glycosyltransferase [Cohnella faecalis]|uniref:Polyprenol-phosphate-mannose--protein mannosyltransferase n=1 Tax=Cohnella faecalis TaxID=2315694 RepID=A0A398CKE4_9BACL|nr:phospholipid carrier-dependent glycosyltransferase [Cohnella faecalis]RIE02622.1 phospholipid carrier-dependent glycosyltransferase [Cohnella faecalis]
MEFQNNAGASPVHWGRSGSSNDSRREERRWKPVDFILVGLLTLAAALMAFTDLGNRTGPQTYWKPDLSGEGFVVDFGQPRQVDRLNLYEGPGAKGQTKIEMSLDGKTWLPYQSIEHSTNRVFTWKHEKDTRVDARYFRFTAERTGYRLYEAAFYTNGVTVPIPVESIEPIGTKGAESEGGGEQLFDEQQWAPERADYRNSMYFDEIYHGRTAYEFVEGMEPYENTHPPLGKVLLAIGVKLFGMTPYGWRFMAAVGGTLMVPLFYWAARGYFRRTRYATLATLLLVMEGFHVVQSRMANVDIFGVTFTIVMFYAMYRFGETAWRNGGLWRGIGYLALSGLFFGMAASVKWNYLYGGAGLAILFFLALIRRIGEARSDSEGGIAKRALVTLVAAAVFFVALPASVYTVSYIPYERATKVDDNWKDLWQYQKNMYHYHKGVKEQHPYASKWYTWPLMLRPVWYYGGKDLAPGDAQSIAAIGNPVVWWVGLLAFIASWWFGIVRRRDRVVLTLTVAYLSFYVPWMVAPRSITFLYHYFPMVPLLILSLVWMLQRVEESFRYGNRVTWIVVGGAAALLVWFYPVYTGITISREWMNIWIRWLPSWGF